MSVQETPSCSSRWFYYSLSSPVGRCRSARTVESVIRVEVASSIPKFMPWPNRKWQGLCFQAGGKFQSILCWSFLEHAGNSELIFVHFWSAPRSMRVSPHHGPSSYLALHFDRSQGVVDDLTAGLFIRWDWIKHWLMGFGQKLGHPQNVKRLGTLKVQQKLIVSLLVAWNSLTIYSTKPSNHEFGSASGRRSTIHTSVVERLRVVSSQRMLLGGAFAISRAWLGALGRWRQLSPACRCLPTLTLVLQGKDEWKSKNTSRLWTRLPHILG